MRSVEVLVVGGGASGMIAAITAAEQGAKVLLIEKMNRLGKKLLATGNGKCNYTNLRQEKSCYHSGEPEFPWEVLQHFTERETIAWFRERGIIPTDREGYVYPLSGQASSVVNILRRMLEMHRVQIHTEEWLEQIRIRQKNPAYRAGVAYEVRTNCEGYLAGQVVLAVGGAAAPVHGTTGDGYAFAKELGLQVIPVLPALTSLVLAGRFCKVWSGVRIKGQIELHSETGECLGRDAGEIQMVAYGISGIPVFQVSHLAAKELAEGRTPYLMLDCVPQITEDMLLEELLRRRRIWPDCSLVDVLEGILPQKLALALIGEAGIKSCMAAEKLQHSQWETLIGQMKHKKLTIRETSGMEKAQVTSGGVAVSQMEKETMEVKSHPGLYLTGELLDVDGICGGYNLQWAWTSGYLAGREAGRKAVSMRKERGKRSGT